MRCASHKQNIPQRRDEDYAAELRIMSASRSGKKVLRPGSGIAIRATTQSHRGNGAQQPINTIG